MMTDTSSGLSLSLVPIAGSYSLIDANPSFLIRVHQFPRAGIALEERKQVGVTGYLVALIQDDIRDRNRIQESLRPLPPCFEGRSDRLQSLSHVSPMRHRGRHDVVRLRLLLQPIQAVLKCFWRGIVV